MTIASAFATAVAWRNDPMRTDEIAAHSLGFIALPGPKSLSGSFIAASIPVLIPCELMARRVGHASSNRGLLAASLAGARMPGGAR